MPGLPRIVFALVALGPALLALLLPDTTHAVLPDQVADAERLDHVADAEKLDPVKDEEMATEIHKQRL